MIKRLKILTIAIFFVFLIVICRLFYWQIIKSSESKEKVLLQSYKIEKNLPQRGKIFTSDNFPLVTNQTNYKISIYKPNLKEDLKNVLAKIEIIKPGFNQENLTLLNNFQNNSNQKWITLPTFFSENEISQIKIPGISSEIDNSRFYPENQLAKNIIGFIGKNKYSNSVGYNGLEAFYDKQLKGKTGFSWVSKDGTGKTIFSKKGWQNEAIDGSDLYTSINRKLQYQVESKLKEGVEKFSADSGSIIILKPETGSILAIASFVATQSGQAQEATISSSRNIAISDLFEPGSIFKPLVVSMALEKKSITPDFICTQCGQPKIINGYTIGNWDSAIHPNSSLRDIIKNSDNIGMSSIIEKLGLNNFLEFYKKLKLTQKTGIDLQGEAKPYPKQNWPPIDLATASFGQGFAITQIQMIQAFNVLANNGFLVKPTIVDYLKENEKIIKMKKTNQMKIFDQKTIDEIRSILKYSVENGVVSKFKPSNLEVCAKSGTAQVAVQGSYTDSSTIASYIGFSPCNNPKFTMIVTINNPKTSPWGSSTAAPIWFELASIIPNLI